MSDIQDTSKPKPKRKETAPEPSQNTAPSEEGGFDLTASEASEPITPYCDTLPEMGGYRQEESVSYSSFTGYPFQTEAASEAPEPKQTNTETSKKGKKVKVETLQSIRAEIAEKQKILDTLLQEIKDLQSKEKKLLEQQETQKKVLIGEAIQNQIKAGKLDQEWLMQLLNLELTRKGDREIFALETHPRVAS